MTNEEREELTDLYIAHDRSMDKVRNHMSTMTYGQACHPRIKWRHLTVLAEAHNAGRIKLKNSQKKALEIGRRRLEQGLGPFTYGNWQHHRIEEPPVLTR